MKILVVIMLFVICAVGCAPSADDPKNVKAPRKEAVIDYKNGVYYFPKTEADFGNALSAFLADQDCKVEGITGDGTSVHGFDAGYFVVCR